MAKKKSGSKAKSSKRALNALEIAERELGGFDSDEEAKRYNSRRNGTVVNLLKKVERSGKQDDGSGDDYSDNDGDSFEDEELDSDEASFRFR